MKKILDLISEEVVKAFEEAGYSADFAKVTLSNRPDLCEYQCMLKPRRRRPMRLMLQ